MTAPRVRLALLWHMHQPYYLDPATGESILPWVRLHALKDYWGMVSAVRAVPGMRVTFNLVPSLVEQVEAYALERTWDRHLVVGLAEAASVPAADAEWFVREGFHAHAPTMIQPYPRYAELAAHARPRRCVRGRRLAAICRSGRSSPGSIPTSSAAMRGSAAWWGRGAISTSTTRPRCGRSSSRSCGG